MNLGKNLKIFLLSQGSCKKVS
uniref:Uncharacterized protein n=1 Tax=Rhizophora mucronata TaxID=61149 RepID=A0A2P2NDJ5_RHIMU